MQQQNVPAQQNSGLTGVPKLLVDRKIINRKIAAEVEKIANKNNISFYRAALKHEKVNNGVIFKAATEMYGIPFFELSVLDRKNLPKTKIPSEVLRENQIAPIYEHSSRLFVAVADPSDTASLDAVRFHTTIAVELILTDPITLEKIIEEVCSAADTSLLGMDDDALDDLDITGDEEYQSSIAQELSEDIDTPIVRFVNKMFLDAINKGASDIHVEPYERSLRIRYRIDGVLHEVPAPPVSMTNQIVSRIKILSRLDIAEKRVPQDGRMKLKLSKSNEIDFRVSSLPTLFGEKIVIRVLDTGGIALDLKALGFDNKQLAIYERAIQRPYGMILVTGPTGSGKSISLYSALNMLNQPHRNISSVEDPVEIYLTGINQVNINSKANVDFALALRAFLRQDPDVIMVGEIRDLETADIAIKASQTGHLVLSTLHTNDAIATVTRLLNMGVEPFNIGSSVHLIMAQRLIRKLCPACKKPVDIPNKALLAAGFTRDQIKDAEIFAANGCSNCTDGYKGRTGIFQLLEISDEMATLIMRGDRQDALEKQAQREGIANLRQSGLAKVLEGIASLEEVERVTNTG